MSFGKQFESRQSVADIQSPVDAEEASFAPAPGPRVTVRRSKLRREDPAAATAPPSADTRAPRVFRVDPPPLRPVPEPAPTIDAAPVGRRIEAVRRPGRAVVVYRAAEQPPAPAPVGYAELAAQLAAVDVTVEAIRKAQSFTLVSAAFASRWQRLGDEVSALHAEIVRRVDSDAEVAEPN